MLAGDAARFSVRGFWVMSGLPSDPSSICVACTHRSVSQFGEQAIDHEHRVSMSGAMGASQLPFDEAMARVMATDLKLLPRQMSHPRIGVLGDAEIHTSKGSVDCDVIEQTGYSTRACVAGGVCVCVCDT